MWSQFAEMGWLAVLVPEHSGGLGWTMVEAAILAQEFGRGLVVEPFLEANVLAVRLLTLADAPAGNALLAGIASGEMIVAPALLEAGSRYDLAAVATRLEMRDEQLMVSGRKVMVAGGDTADNFLVSVTDGLSTAVLLVPANAAGLTREIYRGLDGGWLCDVTLDAVRLPVDALLVHGDRALEILRQAQDEAAMAAAAEAVGCMDRILEMTADYLRTRQQFGHPLADFQVLQHRMADLFVETEMARSALHSGLSQLGSDEEPRAAAISAARVRIDQAAHKVGNQGIHLHGGMGMTVEYPVGHYYRRLLILARTFGDTDFHFDRYEQLRVSAL
jgi:alkylation response protein AidB-like acyl-CoA dehydrogenase